MYIKEDKMLGTLDPTHFVHPRQASKMQSRPDMIAQFTNHAVERLRPKIPREFADPEIYGMARLRSTSLFACALFGSSLRYSTLSLSFASITPTLYVPLQALLLPLTQQC